MILTFDHLLNSSLLFWTRNLIEGKGQAYISGSGWFYDTQEVYGGRFSYSSPYKPFVADSSIGGASIITGIYLDNIFITTGVSGLTGIDYNRGAVYFISGITYANNPAHTRLSGNFSVSEFSYKLTNEPEENLLFETKYSLKPKTNQTVTGLGPSDMTFPIIFFKSNGSRNNVFALGGIEETINSFRLVILAESQYQLDGATSLLRDKTRAILPLLTGISEIPFNAYGGYSGPIYNYNTTFTGKFSTSNSATISDIRVTRIVGQGLTELRKINPTVFAGLVDVDVSSIRRPKA